jgi:hypothetical protein
MDNSRTRGVSFCCRAAHVFRREPSHQGRRNVAPITCRAERMVETPVELLPGVVDIGPEQLKVLELAI